MMARKSTSSSRIRTGFSGNGILAGTAAVSSTAKWSARRQPSGMRNGCSGVVTTDRHGGNAPLRIERQHPGDVFVLEDLRDGPWHAGDRVDDLRILIQAFDQGRLRIPDLTDHEHIRTGNFFAIKSERTIAETSPKYVTTDVDPIAAKASLGDEGIGRLEMGGRHAVGEPARFDPHFKPRHIGNAPKVKLKSCSPSQRWTSRRHWPAACSTSPQAAESSSVSSAVTVM